MPYKLILSRCRQRRLNFYLIQNALKEKENEKNTDSR
jgi:hypothetical protein